MCRCRICYFNVACVEAPCHKMCAGLLCILKNCIHVYVGFRYTIKIGMWRSFFQDFDGRLGFIDGLTWYVKSWHGCSYDSLAVLMLKFISKLYRCWFMCGYYLLIKHLHDNMTRFSTWDRGSIDQIYPLSIAPFVYAFWMNVLGTGTPSLSHLLYMRQELSHTFLHHCNGIWHTWNPYGLLMFTLHDWGSFHTDI